jgi:hypothetical protein
VSSRQPVLVTGAFSLGSGAAAHANRRETSARAPRSGVALMKMALIAAGALLALPGAALAQQHGGGSHGGSGHGGGGHGGGGRGAGGFHGAGAVRAGAGFSAAGGGFRGAPAVRGAMGSRGAVAPGGGLRSHFAAGPVARFGAREFAAWRGGYWWHGFRGGRIGWWWFADGFWYWYDAPVYPYPLYVGDYYVASEGYAPPAPVSYYCYEPRGYYPYIPACPTGWRVVPADPGEDGPP